MTDRTTKPVGRQSGSAGAANGSADARSQRRQEIFDAAYAVLEEKGYKGASMLAVAKAARASNETMYAWFGNKQGLLKAMVDANADAARRILQDALASGSHAFDALSEAGPELIRLVTSDRAIALNRAAAADVAEGGELGRTIANHGREVIGPMLAGIFARAMEQGLIGTAHDPVEVAEIYIALLIGDSQIRRVIGVAPEPSGEAIEGHSARVLEILATLYQ